MQSAVVPSTQMAVKEYGYFAGNQWRNAVDNQVFEVHEPYSGKLFARVAAGTRADARVAVDGLQHSALSDVERGAVLGGNASRLFRRLQSALANRELA